MQHLCEELRDAIPSNILSTLDNFVEKGWSPGGCVTAILENKLMEAYMQADPYTTVAMPTIVKYIYNCLPSISWGSPERVQAWVDKGGFEGRER